MTSSLCLQQAFPVPSFFHALLVCQRKTNLPSMTMPTCPSYILTDHIVTIVSPQQNGYHHTNWSISLHPVSPALAPLSLVSLSPSSHFSQTKSLSVDLSYSHHTTTPTLAHVLAGVAVWSPACLLPQAVSDNVSCDAEQLLLAADEDRKTANRQPRADFPTQDLSYISFCHLGLVVALTD